MPARVTIGERDYHVRARHNLEEWEKLVQRIRFDPKTRTVSADVSELLQEGVRPEFVGYALRERYLREVLVTSN